MTRPAPTLRRAVATATLAVLVAACGLPAGEVVHRACYVGALGVDATRVYWIDQCTSELWAWDKQTGAATRLAQRSGRLDVLATELLVVDDADDLYWKTLDGIVAVRKDGTGERLVYMGGTALAADATDLYVLARGALLRIPKAGGAPVELANDLTGGSVEGGGIVLADAGAVYVAALDGIYRIPKSGSGGKTAIAFAPQPPTGMAMDDLAVYWISTGDRWLRCQSKNGAGGCAGGMLNAIHDVYRPVAIAVDDHYVYWLTRYYGTVKRVSKETDGVDEIAEAGTIGGGSLAVDATHIYWTAPGDGESTIRRVAKP